ncbi:MAG: universal stress protein [Pseudomonadota bacterium]
MAKISKILAIANPLVALSEDHPSVGQPACDRGAQIAKMLGASLRLHAVVYEPSANFDLFHIADEDHVRHQFREDAQALLDQLAARYAKQGLADVDTSTQWAHPFDRGVIGAVELDWPDVVMITARNAQRLSPAEWRLLHGCEIPVWLVRDEPWPNPARIAAFVDPAHRSAHRSQADREVLNWTLALHNQVGDARLMHAIQQIPGEGLDDDMHDYLAEVKAQRQEEITRLLPGDGGVKLPIELAPGEPEILMRDFAQGDDAALVVMGVFSRSRLADLLIGSTAREVLPDLPCDVLAVPADR